MTFDYHSQYLEYRKYLNQLMKQVKSPVARASLAVVGALLFATFLAIAALKPTLVTVASLTRNIRDERQTISTLDKKIQSLQVAQKKLEDIKTRLGPANVAIPDRVSIEDFTKELEILASQHGLVLLEVTQDGFLLSRGVMPTPRPGTIPKVSSIPIRVVVGGTEEAVRSFIADIENLDRLAVITTANFTEIKLEERKDRPYPVSADLSLQIFTTQQIEERASKKPAASSTGE